MKITHCSRLGRGLLKRERRVALENKASLVDSAQDVCALSYYTLRPISTDFTLGLICKCLALVCHLTRSEIPFPDIRLRSHAIGCRGALSAHRNAIYKTNQMLATAQEELAFFALGNTRCPWPSQTCRLFNTKQRAFFIFVCIFLPPARAQQISKNKIITTTTTLRE